jgi:ribonuclease VapC
MIVVDASALIAILEKEPEGDRFLQAIHGANRAVVSALTLLEAGMVMRGRRGPEGLNSLMVLIEGTATQILPFDAGQLQAALGAFDRYGKGIHPQARLNLGDCVSYALAKTMNAPLLFKGDDFRATDVAACL